jgi:tRNA(Ile)-lysidine synthase
MPWALSFWDNDIVCESQDGCKVNLDERIVEALTAAGVKAGERVLAACSGGADSMFLLHVLLKLAPGMGISVCAAHLDHNVRGEEAREDARLVAGYCIERGVVLESGLLSADEIGPLKGREGSLEAALRHLRYRFLDASAGKLSADWIVTGHHADDQAETVLFRAARGMNWRSLAGIPSRREKLVRPLLDITAKDILDRAHREKLSFSVDKSNLDNRFSRNRIRNQVIPSLRKNFHPDVSGLLIRLGRATARLNIVEERVLAASGVDIPDHGQGEVASLSLQKLRNLDGEPQRGAISRFVHVAADYYPGTAVTDSLVEMINTQKTGDTTLPTGWVARVGSGALTLIPPGHLAEKWTGDYLICQWPAAVFVKETGTFFSIEKGSFKGSYPSRGSLECLLDSKKVVWPLTVRTRRTGDRFRPLGTGGERKLKEMLVDRKVPRHQRDQLLLVVDGESDIIWVSGVEISEKVRVQDDPEETELLHLSVSRSGEQDQDQAT